MCRGLQSDLHFCKQFPLWFNKYKYFVLCLLLSALEDRSSFFLHKGKKVLVVLTEHGVFGVNKSPSQPSFFRLSFLPASMC